MRLSYGLCLILLVGNAVGETVAADDDAACRTQALIDQFHCDPGSLHHRLQNYFVASGHDDEWSPRAEVRLSDWFKTAEGGDDVEVACVADLCAVDFFVSFHEFATTYRSMTQEWDRAKHEGFLKESFFFPRGDGSTRLFVFRDSFDPASL